MMLNESSSGLLKYAVATNKHAKLRNNKF